MARGNISSCYLVHTKVCTSQGRVCSCSVPHRILATRGSVRRLPQDKIPKRLLTRWRVYLTDGVVEPCKRKRYHSVAPWRLTLAATKYTYKSRCERFRKIQKRMRTFCPGRRVTSGRADPGSGKGSRRTPHETSHKHLIHGVL